MKRVELTDREIALVLAALRNWQNDAEDFDMVEVFSGHFEDYEPLSDEEIDDLCQRINFAGDSQVITKAAW